MAAFQRPSCSPSVQSSPPSLSAGGARLHSSNPAAHLACRAARPSPPSPSIGNQGQHHAANLVLCRCPELLACKPIYCCRSTCPRRNSHRCLGWPLGMGRGGAGGGCVSEWGRRGDGPTWDPGSEGQMHIHTPHPLYAYLLIADICDDCNLAGWRGEVMKLLRVRGHNRFVVCGGKMQQHALTCWPPSRSIRRSLSELRPTCLLPGPCGLSSSTS